MCFTVVRTTFMKDIGCSNVMTTFPDWNNRKTETYKKREINGFCECQHWHWHRIKANHFIYVILQKIRIYLLIKICAWHGVNFSTENARILLHHSCQIFSGHTHTSTHIFTPNQVALSNQKRNIGALYAGVAVDSLWKNDIREKSVKASTSHPNSNTEWIQMWACMNFTVRWT